MSAVDWVLVERLERAVAHNLPMPDVPRNQRADYGRTLIGRGMPRNRAARVVGTAARTLLTLHSQQGTAA